MTHLVSPDNSVVTATTQCPHCRHRFDRASLLGEEKLMPEAGDYSICIECGAILIFTDGEGHLRAATVKDIGALMQEPEQWATIEKAQYLIRQSGLTERKAQ